MGDTLNRSVDYLVVKHSDGREEKVPLPPAGASPLRVGREIDNDVVLSDPRASRYHAQVRRGITGVEIMDADSANGTLVGGRRLKPNTWQLLTPGAVAYLGDTALTVEPALASAATVSMAPVSAPESPLPSRPTRSPAALPWAGIAGGLVLLLVIVVGAILWTGRETPAGPTTGATTADQGDLVAQTPGGPPSAGTPSGEGRLIPYPVINLEEVRVAPVILGALPDPNKALIIVRVRVENQGTDSFTVSPDQFELIDASGMVLAEAGGNYSEEGLRKMGLADRYQNLRLGPGDSVPESLLFTGEARPYEIFLRYQGSGQDPITIDLGKVDAQREVARLLGTPVGEASPVAVAQAGEISPIATPVPTPTPTRPAMPAPRTVPTSSLVGTIAYPVFNGSSYDLYFGNADGSGTQFFLNNASQPQFSSDGGRIAYHSWDKNRRGLITRNVAGGNEHIVAGNLEDQLPTWSPDGETIIFLSRRSGQRASELFRVSSVGGDPQFIGHGEYPSWSPNGQLAFKGWQSDNVGTGIGLRLSPPDLTTIQELTSEESDTAPVVSPDGQQIAFMSRRDGNWNIYVVNGDGKGLRQLTDDPAEDGLPAWSPDGRVIAFVSNRGGPWAVWAVPASGGGERQLFTMQGSPDGFVEGEDRDKSRGWAEERISWTR